MVSPVLDNTPAAMLIDAMQISAIRRLMKDRFSVASALFIEYTDLRIETLEIAVEEGRSIAPLLAPIQLIKDNAAAIGAQGLSLIASMIQQTMEDMAATNQNATALKPLIADLRLCFHQTRHYFKYTVIREDVRKGGY